MEVEDVNRAFILIVAVRERELQNHPLLTWQYPEVRYVYMNRGFADPALSK